MIKEYICTNNNGVSYYTTGKIYKVKMDPDFINTIIGDDGITRLFHPDFHVEIIQELQYKYRESKTIPTFTTIEEWRDKQLTKLEIF